MAVDYRDIAERFASHYQNSAEYALENPPSSSSSGRSLGEIIEDFNNGVRNPVTAPPSSGLDTTGMWSLYDPTWSGVSVSSQADPDEAEQLRRSLSPYAHLYSMDEETAYQEALASTSHQREVADLRAAGLNPVLAAGAGSGASVFSGSYAPVLSTGSGGSSGFSAGSGRDGSSIADKIKDLNWRSASSSLGYAITSALSGNVASAVGNTVQGVIKLLT